MSSTQVTDASDTKLSPLVAVYLAKRADLVRFFALRTSSPVEAEDVVQEIFLRIANLDSSEIENPSAYLYRLGANAMVDRVRKRQRAASREKDYVAVGQPSHGGEMASDSPSPEAAWEARERLHRVLAAINLLPPKRRRVFIMHRLESLSYAEIASQLRISKSAVEKHMTAALRQLAGLNE